MKSDFYNRFSDSDNLLDMKLRQKKLTYRITSAILNPPSWMLKMTSESNTNSSGKNQNRWKWEVKIRNAHIILGRRYIFWTTRKQLKWNGFVKKLLHDNMCIRYELFENSLRVKVNLFRKKKKGRPRLPITSKFLQVILNILSSLSIIWCN